MLTTNPPNPHQFTATTTTTSIQSSNTSAGDHLYGTTTSSKRPCRLSLGLNLASPFRCEKDTTNTSPHTMPPNSLFSISPSQFNHQNMMAATKKKLHSLYSPFTSSHNNFQSSKGNSTFYRPIPRLVSPTGIHEVEHDPRRDGDEINWSRRHDDFQASQILPHVYLGDEIDASQMNRLTDLGIKHVLRITAYPHSASNTSTMSSSVSSSTASSMGDSPQVLIPPSPMSISTCSTASSTMSDSESQTLNPLSNLINIQQIIAEDSSTANLHDHFEQAFKFIGKCDITKIPLFDD